MKKCVNCGEMINDTAMFCRFCGKKVEEVNDVLSVTCPHCSNPVRAGAKFCRHCGQALHVEEPGTSASENGIAVRDRYVTWRVLPGQLAVKVDEDDIVSYGKPKGIEGLYVAPGTKALLFADGRCVAMLDSGRYKFREIEKSGDANEEISSESAVHSFFSNLAEHVKDGLDRWFSFKVKTYSVLLIKGSEFPLVFECKDVPTKNLRSDIALHILCKIDNLSGFYNGLMTDKPFISTETFANSITQLVNSTLYRVVADVNAEEINHNPGLAKLILEKLQLIFEEIYPYVAVTNVIDIVTEQKELERLRQLKEDLYIAEQELEQAQLRNDFMNRLQNSEYNNRLQEARSRVEFEALMDQVNRDGLLNQDERDRFIMMLNAERTLRAARTEMETANAFDQLAQSRMLSQAELNSLKEMLHQKASMKALENAHLLRMVTLQNEMALDKERLNWEIEIGNIRRENQFMICRAQDEYADWRAKVKWEEHEQKIKAKLDTLRQMDEIKAAREEREHKNRMEEQKQDIEKQQAILSMYAQMSEAQIMAANPNISPEAAKALAEKFKADAVAAQNSKVEAVLSQSNEQMLHIMEQMIHNINDAKERELAMKQEEINRVYAASQKEQDRFLTGVQSVASAFSGAASANRPGGVDRVSPAPANRFCENCGVKAEPGSVNCSNCGRRL